MKLQRWTEYSNYPLQHLPALIPDFNTTVAETHIFTGMHNCAQRQLRLSPGTNTNSYIRTLDSNLVGLKSKNRTALATRGKLELDRTAQTVNKEHKRGLSMKTHILPQVGAPSPSSHSRYHARSNIFIEGGSNRYVLRLLNSWDAGGESYEVRCICGYR